MHQKRNKTTYLILLLVCVSLSWTSVYADNASLSIIPDTFVYGTDQTLTIIGSDTQFLGFGELQLPVAVVGFIAENGEVITVPAKVLSDYALHLADLSILEPGVYEIEVRNENMDAYRLTGISLTVVSPASQAGEETAEEGEETDIEPIDEAIIDENAGKEQDKSEQMFDQSLKQLAITYTLTVDAGPGGSILSVPNEHVGGFLFSIVPDEGYEVIDVLVDGSSVGAVSEYLFETVQANHSIAAVFEKVPIIEYCITATAGPRGSIMPNGIVCVPEGDSIEFTITANEENSISDLLVDGAFVGASDSYVFDSVSEEHSITAFFAAIPVVTSCITAVAGNGGQIIPSGEICSSGKDVTFSIVPDENYSVADVMVDGMFIGPVLEYVIAEPTEDHTIFVSFIHQ